MHFLMVESERNLHNLVAVVSTKTGSAAFDTHEFNNGSRMLQGVSYLAIT